MASVRNVKLSIGRAQGLRRRVEVTYELCFTRCEALAGSVFNETVALRGDDPIFDDALITLRRTCVKAEEQGCIKRSVTRTVSRSALDEDGDTIIFGIPIHAARDEIYARVTLTPFTPSGSRGDSNVVAGQFGPAGND